MNIDLRPSTCRMIEASPAAREARAFIEWLHAEGYTDYTIDCHIRRLLFVMPRLSPGTAPPVLHNADLTAVFGREGHPRSRLFSFAGTRRAYTRYLRAQERLVPEPQAPFDDSSNSMTSTSPRFAGCLSQRAVIRGSRCERCWRAS
jgi:hypothetical protein